MLDDRFWVQKQDFFGQRVVVPTANNGDFVANAIEVLAGGDDLVGLRSRGTSARPFEVVEQIQRAADERYAAEQQRAASQAQGDPGQAAQPDRRRGQATRAAAPDRPTRPRRSSEFRADMVTTRQQLRQVQAALAPGHRPAEDRSSNSSTSR